MHIQHNIHIIHEWASILNSLILKHFQRKRLLWFDRCWQQKINFGIKWLTNNRRKDYKTYALVSKRPHDI